MDLYEQSRTLIYSSPVTRKTRSESGFHEWDDLVASLLDNYCGLPFYPCILSLMWFIVLLTREEQQQNFSSVKRRLISRVDCTPLRKGLNSFFEAIVSIIPAAREFWWRSWRTQGQVRGRLTWNLEVPFNAHISIYYFPFIKPLYPPIYPVRDIRSPATEMENLSFWGYCFTSAEGRFKQGM